MTRGASLAEASRPVARPPGPPWRLWVGLFGAAGAWAVQTVAVYGVVAHACYPKRVPVAEPVIVGARPLAMAASLVLLCAAAAAWRIAWRELQATQRTSAGAGRERGWAHFLALAGLLASTIFCFGIAMNALPLFVGPLCTVAS